MILPAVRDPRRITIRRGGSLIDEDHHRLARWAAECAEHVLPLFEAARAWTRGELPMMQTRAFDGHAMGAARDLTGAPRFAAFAAGQAAVVAHVVEHDLGAAAYAIKAAVAAASRGHEDDVRRAECLWQRDRLPVEVRELVLEDQGRRSAICWNVFDD